MGTESIQIMSFISDIENTKLNV